MGIYWNDDEDDDDRMGPALSVALALGVAMLVVTLALVTGAALIVWRLLS